MLYAFLGGDRTKARAAMHALIEKKGNERQRVIVSDAHTLADLEAVLQGGGMFAQPRAVILDSVLSSTELRERLVEALPRLGSSDDLFCIFEEKIDVATKRVITKYAEEVETFDAAKSAPDNAIFKLRFALEKGDKKTLWVGLMHEYAAGKAPEATHGFLFWAAKQMVLGARNETSAQRAKKMLASLAELPHESRRKGIELEYALEKFVLSIA